MLIRSLICALCFPFATAIGGTVTKTMTVSAQIVNGCLIGSTPATSANFGTIDFGSMPRVNNVVDVASSVGNGSIVVICTPGTSLTISLNLGVNSEANQRYLRHSSGTKLAYQLYKNATYNQVWGTNTDALGIASFPLSPQTYTVYARLFATSLQPPAGLYTDTVTVTLTY
jgi:spore coat protein U-like protein